jgi:hypothetical protein
VLDVAFGRVREPPHSPDSGTRRALPGLAHPALDHVLDVVGQFVPAAGEELDPVVRHRVVRGGQHHAEIGTGGRDQVGDRRSRHHADVLDVHPGAGQPGDHGGGEELTGGPGIPADDGPGTATVGIGHLTQDMRRRHRQVESHLGRDVAIGEPTHAIGAE